MFSYRTLFKIVIILAAIIVAAAKLAHAQTPVPAPRIAQLIWDDNVDFTYVYNQGPFNGLSYIREVRVTLTPPTGSAVISTVPIGQVTAGTTAAACPGGAFPCRKILDLAAPFGAYTVTITVVTREDLVSDPSTGIPFTGRG